MDSNTIENIKSKYAVFTSMNKAYYDRCGHALLSTYKSHWRNLIPLYVYNEDNFQIKSKNVASVKWNLGENYLKFQKRHTNDKVKTFAKKGFSVIHAMKNLDYDRIIWLDADTIIKAPIPNLLLDLIAADDILSTHFSVWHNQDNIEYHSCETGFFILNTKHSGYKEFCQTYEDIYINDKTDGLRRFYDGEVYGKTVELMEEKGYKMMNLNPGRHKTPISRSLINPYITHFKAGLKDTVDFTKYDTEEHED